MGDRSLKKKKHIIETARGVFAQKGFKTVTMKDIVEACGISRGGLYLYFSSTDEIFEELLRQEKRQSMASFTEEVTEDATAMDILMLFF